MTTSTKENYLKALYFLNKKDSKITITDLGKQMNVSNPTVNNMVKKLQDKGWIIYKKYSPLTLTSNGQKAAALIIRKHRLAEMFLSQIMGFGWEEVHDIAEEMEHLKSEILFTRMNELLGYPTIDPHGSPIPDSEGNYTRINFKTLSDTKIGQKVRVSALNNSSKELLIFLNKKNIRLGTEIIIQQIESFDESYLVKINDNQLDTLSLKVCNSLLIQEI